LAIAIVGVIISIGYYFGWLRAAFFSVWRVPGPDAASTGSAICEPSPAGRLTLLALAAATVLLGFFQGYLGGGLLGG
jgi:NADH-quinone oxidoreductase subunit N